MTYPTIQQLMEIELDTEISKTDMDPDGARMVWRELSDHDHDDFNKWISKLPMMGGLKLFVNDSTHYKWFIFLKPVQVEANYHLEKTLRRSIVGSLALRKQGHAWQVEAAALDKKYQGKGLMLDLYVMIVTKMKLTLMSDHTQSVGGMKLWRALSKQPGVFVYAWDTVKKKAMHAFPHDDGTPGFSTPVGDTHTDPEMASSRGRGEYTASVKRTRLYRMIDREEMKRNPNQDLIKQWRQEIKDLQRDEVDQEKVDDLEYTQTAHTVLIAIPGKTAKDT